MEDLVEGSQVFVCEGFGDMWEEKGEDVSQGGEESLGGRRFFVQVWASNLLPN